MLADPSVGETETDKSPYYLPTVLPRCHVTARLHDNSNGTLPMPRGFP